MHLWRDEQRRHGYAETVALDATARLRTSYLENRSTIEARVREAVAWWQVALDAAVGRGDRLSAAVNILDATGYASDVLRDSFVLALPKGSDETLVMARWRKDVDIVRVSRWAVTDMGVPGAKAVLSDLRFDSDDEEDWHSTAALATWLSAALAAWYEDRYQRDVAALALSDLGEPGRLVAMADELDRQAWRTVSRDANVPEVQRAVLVDSLTALRLWRANVLAYSDPDRLRPGDLLDPLSRVSGDFGPQTRFVVCRFVADEASPLEPVFDDQGATRRRIAEDVVKCPRLVTRKESDSG